MRIESVVPGTEQPDPNAPSNTRGANFIIESMRVGPEETSYHFMSLPYAERKQVIGDIAEFMMFCREWWNALSTCHLGLAEKDAPKQESYLDGGSGEV